MKTKILPALLSSAICLFKFSSLAELSFSKPKCIFFSMVFITALSVSNAVIAQATNAQDSLALVDFYSNTNGPNWNNHTNWLTGPVNTWYGITLTGNRVTSISFFANNLYGALPSSIGNLSALTYLSIWINSLQGSIPASIGNLTNLTYLSLSSNELTGNIPSSIGNLNKLTDLRLDNNDLSGSIPSSIGNLSALKFLVIENNQFTGIISSSIGSLSNLTQFLAAFNQLSGAIPASIGDLAKLNKLRLSSNQLTGSIPASLGNLDSLTSLYLHTNNLTGAIPSSLGNLTNLSELSLSNNNLTGTIPSSLGNLTNLTFLDAFNNQLSGSLPVELGNMKNVHGLNFSNNQLTGKIPLSFRKLKNIASLRLDHNHLSFSDNIHFPSSEVTSIAGIYINDNDFTFNGLEFMAQHFLYCYYSPQASIPLHKYNSSLSVSAGGTLSNNIYKWFRIGVTDPVAVITGDSVFHPAENGDYYAQVTNALANQLTLYTDTLNYSIAVAKNVYNSQNVIIKKEGTLFFTYPNPARNSINIQLSGIADVILLNQSGKVLLTKRINSRGEINVSHLSAGLYYLRNNETGASKKIVISP